MLNHQTVDNFSLISGLVFFGKLLLEQCRSVSVSVGNNGSVGTCLWRKKELYVYQKQS